MKLETTFRGAEEFWNGARIIEGLRKPVPSESGTYLTRRPDSRHLVQTIAPFAPQDEPAVTRTPTHISTESDWLR
jgi:hypothetical protein